MCVNAMNCIAPCILSKFGEVWVELVFIGVCQMCGGYSYFYEFRIAGVSQNEWIY